MLFRSGLLKLQKNHALTHIFIAQAEYEENSSYYEKISDEIQVVAIAEKDFVLHKNSRLLVIRKPFFCTVGSQSVKWGSNRKRV